MILPAEPKPEDVTAIVDTREQTPLDLAPLKMELGSLTTGDYSVKGLESVIAIERKSLDDLVACCGVERDRFDREMQRILAYPVRSLVIESSWQAVQSDAGSGYRFVAWLVSSWRAVDFGGRPRTSWEVCQPDVVHRCTPQVA